MMGLERVVHKWEIPLYDMHLEIDLDSQAKVVGVGIQHNKPVVWIERRPGVPTSRRLWLNVHATGMIYAGIGEHVGMFQMQEANDTEFVGHVYATWGPIA
jgi:hypothetical protein